jgi:NTE family protein
MKWRGRCVALALGGGGARGLAHIGVLKVLDEERIPVDILVGTSIGALVGAAYASGMNPAAIEERVEEYLNTPEFQNSAIRALEEARAREGEAGLAQKIQNYFRNRYYMVQALLKPGIINNDDFQETINFFLPDISIEETRTAFRAVATDLVGGKQIVFSSGSLRQAVGASCAVPGAVEPFREGDRLLSDGGIICLVPISVARKEGADIVVAVGVDSDVCSSEALNSVIDIYYRASEIMSHELVNYELMDADVLIQPEVGDLHWSSFSQAMDLIQEGERAAREKLPLIKSAVPGGKKWFTLKQLLKSKKKGA